MNFDGRTLENMLFEWVDQIKVLISQETWENILLNCTKNELLVLMLLYRHTDVNMTQIADYLNAPLNTTTGIVSRMEKKMMVARIRSQEDKRVVTIQLTASGNQQIKDIIDLFLAYGQKIIGSLTAEEFKLMSGVIGKVVTLLQETDHKQQSTENKIRKIVIE